MREIKRAILGIGIILVGIGIFWGLMMLSAPELREEVFYICTREQLNQAHHEYRKAGCDRWFTGPGRKSNCYRDSIIKYCTPKEGL